jgi:DNA helicase-4
LKTIETRLAKTDGDFITKETERFAFFFDSIESNPLTESQREACVINDDRNLVFAGAGTGKTSTIIGRTGYLLASKQCSPEEILLLAFGKEASEEMRERQETQLKKWLRLGSNTLPTIETFHALGNKIVGKACGRRYDITPFAEGDYRLLNFIEKTIQNLCKKDAAFCEEIISYYRGGRYPYKSPFDFESMEEYWEYIAENQITTLRGESVKSFEECIIANFLALHGVEYEYEAPYKFTTQTPDHRQYKPDFYIKGKGIYLEHFAINRQRKPPKHFNQREYLQGICWKRELHKKNGTLLLETYSYLQQEGILEMYLEELLKKAEVTIVPRSSMEKLQELNRLLKKLNKKFVQSELSALLGRMIFLFKESEHDKKIFNDENLEKIGNSPTRKILKIFHPIYEAYEKDLEEKNQIDFSDMIIQATEYIKRGAYASPYKHILIDEFQDINKARMDLVMALIHQNPETILFAVGDDWQSIYRFAGSDISYMRDFEKHYGPAAKVTLDTSFRCNDVIAEVASKFIMKNPRQVQKEIHSITTVDHPAVYLVPMADSSEALPEIFQKIKKLPEYKKSKEKKSLLVLGRYHYTYRTEKLKRKDGFPGMDMDFMTVHGAKGKEADYVIVLDVVDKKFPSQKKTDAAIEFFLPQSEEYPFAEERRLFYVALTRARHGVFLVYDPQNPSFFVIELLREKDSRKICFIDESQHVPTSYRPCPKCLSGILRIKEGRHGKFTNCTNYPYCAYTEQYLHKNNRSRK